MIIPSLPGCVLWSRGNQWLKNVSEKIRFARVTFEAGILFAFVVVEFAGLEIILVFNQQLERVAVRPGRFYSLAQELRRRAPRVHALPA